MSAEGKCRVEKDSVFPRKNVVENEKASYNEIEVVGKIGGVSYVQRKRTGFLCVSIVQSCKQMEKDTGGCLSNS